ncbi:MAG: hypothetical protein QM756_00320 [Polyangiaceae bacterium]
MRWASSFWCVVGASIWLYSSCTRQDVADDVETTEGFAGSTFGRAGGTSMGAQSGVSFPGCDSTIFLPTSGGTTGQVGPVASAGEAGAGAGGGGAEGGAPAESAGGSSGSTPAAGAAGQDGNASFGCPRREPTHGSVCDWSGAQCHYGSCTPTSVIRSYTCCAGVWHQWDAHFCN